MSGDSHGGNGEGMRPSTSKDSDRVDNADEDPGQGTRNDRDDYYGSRPSEDVPVNDTVNDPNEASDNDLSGQARFGQGESATRRGESGTSGSEGGRGFGAPWSPHREPGNSEYDHGAFDEGQPTDRAYGQGMYNQNVGQSGQENPGEVKSADDWGSHAPGSKGNAEGGAATDGTAEQKNS
ncbi:MAG TPA: hypothetical protein VE869_18495 [Gemmatimonas sp.]|nr:hypothetical protein [Gemmatimonas sp.]